MPSSKFTFEFRLAELASHLDAQLTGDDQCVITGIASLKTAKKGQISFLTDGRYRQYLSSTEASAVVLSVDDAADCPTNTLVVDNPHASCAKLTSCFLPTVSYQTGAHPSVIQGEGAQISASASIGANVVLGAGVQIAQGVVIEPGCVLGDDVVIGENSHLSANVTIYSGVVVGQRTRIHSGAVIGADGFGFAKNTDGSWGKIHQLGAVVIGDDVEIGANTTIDCGALGDTVISNGVKLDNQIQIAHNVHIGERTIIAACTGVAGSTKIGKDCMIGGGVGIGDHVELADRVYITAMSAISKSIKESGVYSSGLPHQSNASWRRSVVRFKQLDEIVKRVTELEKYHHE